MTDRLAMVVKSNCASRGTEHTMTRFIGCAWLVLLLAARVGSAADAAYMAEIQILSLKSGAGKVRIGSLEFHIREIGDVYYMFVDDLKNPAIANFKGNSWFAIDDSYRVPATFVAYPGDRESRAGRLGCNYACRTKYIG